MTEGVPPEAEPPWDGGADGLGAGIHTFLIADVRGYTLFTQERGDEAAAKLAAKFASIAREGVEKRSGQVIELRGDEALAVFASARQAIRAALDLQELFAEETVAAPDLPLLVGIGLDAGEAVPVESGYRGGALNLAARLCGMAAPGEVLASREVTHLARRMDAVRFEDRGAVQLKGLSDPVTVIRVVSEDADVALRLAPYVPARPEAGPPPPEAKPRMSWPVRLLIAGLVVALFAVGIVALVRPKAAAERITACQVSAGTLEDGYFNQAIHDGMTHAQARFDVRTQVGITNNPDEDAPVFRKLVTSGCSVIITQPDVEEAMTKSAQANPIQSFVVIDPFQPPALPNVLGVSFATDQGAFLAGYLAASVTKTGKVATFGGVPIPTVLPFMDGFAAGVLKYNRDHHAEVELLGWNPIGGTGSFLSQSDFGAFNDTEGGLRVGKDLIEQGADIVFPVAGPAGLGAAQAAKESGKVLLIGVDFDQFYKAPEFADLWLTSVRKRYDLAVENVVELVVDGTFKGGGDFVGNLANGSVDLAPFHSQEGLVTEAMRDELATLKAGIADGTVSVDPRDYGEV